MGDGCCKYLGIGEKMLHARMKNKIEKEYLHRSHKILSSELNSKSKIQALNIFTVPVSITVWLWCPKLDAT